MSSLPAVLGVFLLAAAAPAAAQTIDLSDALALEQVRASNPEHVERITQIVAGLREQPSRVQGEWLQATFGAKDVDVEYLVVPASNPPKQSLRFTLDDVRYQITVVRSDIARALNERLSRELQTRSREQTLLR